MRITITFNLGITIMILFRLLVEPSLLLYCSHIFFSLIVENYLTTLIEELEPDPLAFTVIIETTIDY